MGLCVCEWRKWDVRGAGLDYSDARPSYFNLFTEPQTRGEECSRTLGPAVEADAIGRAAVEADAIGEQQLKRTQSGSSSRRGRDREQQLKRTQAVSSSWSGCNRGAAAGSGGKRGAVTGKRMPRSGPGAAAEADASGKQQLKRTQSGRGSSAQRAVRRRITHGRRTRGK